VHLIQPSLKHDPHFGAVKVQMHHPKRIHLDLEVAYYDDIDRSAVDQDFGIH
jgi:hypothetical protein